jgi:hypothetical protein
MANIKTTFSAIVDSLHGWQDFDLGSPRTRIVAVTGGWTVDRNSYVHVGCDGHVGQAAVDLAPYNSRKYDRLYPFGSLLMEIPGQGQRYVPGAIDLAEPITRVRLRINDRDDSLGDNAGALMVVFE